MAKKTPKEDAWAENVPNWVVSNFQRYKSRPRDVPKNQAWCSSCKKLKHVADFSTDRFRASGVNAVCKVCDNARRALPSSPRRSHRSNPSPHRARKGHRWCGRCSRYLVEASEFYKNRSRADGYNTLCKECCKASVSATILRTGSSGSVAARMREFAKKGVVSDIDREYILALSRASCVYCGYSPKEDQRSGIDRFDSSRGYVYGNCVPCCGWCNVAKLDHPFSEQLEWARRFVAHSATLTKTPPPTLSDTSDPVTWTHPPLTVSEMPYACQQTLEPTITPAPVWREGESLSTASAEYEYVSPEEDSSPEEDDGE